MRLRTTALLVAALLGPAVSLQTAAAQDERPDSSPLTITTDFSFDASGNCKAGQVLVARFHYEGAKPLHGYLVTFGLADPKTGKVQQERAVQGIRDSRLPMIASGEEWTRTVCLPSKIAAADPPPVAVKVDVLKFADGSTWGPIALRQSHQLVGMLDGMDFLGKTTELARFVAPILPERGPLPAADVESETIGPLKIESGIWRDERGQEMLAAAVTNQSDKPIRGYLLTTSFFDPTTGARIRRFSTKELETHGNPSDYLAPGATWVADPRKFSHLPDGTLATYEISVDLVVFADGTTFGPKKSQESDEVLGMFWGIDVAIHSSQGIPATEKQ
jgi:hypothetical protein